MPVQIAVQTENENQREAATGHPNGSGGRHLTGSMGSVCPHHQFSGFLQSIHPLFTKNGNRKAGILLYRPCTTYPITRIIAPRTRRGTCSMIWRRAKRSPRVSYLFIRIFLLIMPFCRTRALASVRLAEHRLPREAVHVQQVAAREDIIVKWAGLCHPTRNYRT